MNVIRVTDRLRLKTTYKIMLDNVEFHDIVDCLVLLTVPFEDSSMEKARQLILDGVPSSFVKRLSVIVNQIVV